MLFRSSLSYRYDPVALSRDVPNLDVNFPSDVVTITVFAAVTDSAGQPSYAARVFALHGSELLIPPVPDASISYTLSNRSGISRTTVGNSNLISVGYGRVQPARDAASAPAGLAIFSLRQNGRWVS